MHPKNVDTLTLSELEDLVQEQGQKKDLIEEINNIVRELPNKRALWYAQDTEHFSVDYLRTKSEGFEQELKERRA